MSAHSSVSSTSSAPSTSQSQPQSPSTRPQPTKQQKIIFIILIIALIIILGIGGYFIYRNLTNSNHNTPDTSLSQPLSDADWVSPDDPYSLQLTDEQVAITADRTLRFFALNRDDRGLYPLTTTCDTVAAEIEDSVCSPGLSNHRLGYAILWGNLLDYQQTGNSSALYRLQEDLQAYRRLLDTNSVSLQNNYYACSFFNEIRQLPEFADDATIQSTLTDLCFLGIYETALVSPGDENYPLETTTALAQIDAKIANLKATFDPTSEESAAEADTSNTNHSSTLPVDSTTSTATNSSSLYDWSRDPVPGLLNYNNSDFANAYYVTDQIDRYFWLADTQLAASDLNQSMYNQLFSDPLVVLPRPTSQEDLLQYLLDDYDSLLSAYYFTGDQLTANQLYTLTLATQQMLRLYQSLNRNASSIQALSWQLQERITHLNPSELNNLSLAELRDLAFADARLTALNVSQTSLNADLSRTLRQVITDNFYYSQGQLTGFSHIYDTFGEATRITFMPDTNGILSGYLFLPQEVLGDFTDYSTLLAPETTSETTSEPISRSETTNSSDSSILSN